MTEHRFGPRGRPPWWPEDRPFPPHGREGWGSMRRGFLRRVAIFLALFLVAIFITIGLAFVVVSGALGLGRHPALFLLSGLVGFMAVVATFVTVARAVRRSAAPIGDVMDAAERVSHGDYSVRVEPRGTPETRRLVGSFNEMAERLGSDERRRRELLADIAHELRTPLSIMRGTAEGILDGLYPPDPVHLEPVLEEINVMARLLDDLMTLSTAEAGALRLHREQVEPSALIDDALASFAAQALSARVELAATVDDGLPELNVDPVRIGEVLANLVTNALRHTPAGGTVMLSAASASDEVVFTVSDTGSGIGAEDLPNVFERFVKSSDSGGAGLGLAIAKSLVEAHGGRIVGRARPEGGTAMSFSLPAGTGSD